MTGDLLLDWAIHATSLFNMVLQLWLGLTVLLNAERRSWGVWLAGESSLLGAAFFVGHSALVGLGFTALGPGLDFWWRLVRLAVATHPFVWYVVMLWFASLWGAAHPGIARIAPRHRRVFWLAATLTATVLILLIFADPLPSFTQAAELNLTATPEVFGLPLLVLVYPVAIIVCNGLALDALRHPAPSARPGGDQARRRVRPWLVATTLTLLTVSLLVAAGMLWLVMYSRQPGVSLFLPRLILPLGMLDLAISGLIALATLFIGRAVATYEVFTGRTLPRRGLQRYWRRAVILAAGIGLVMGGSLAAGLPSVYGLLLAACLPAVFYALVSWRAFAEREQVVRMVRPFVASQRVYDQLLDAPESDAAGILARPFAALCRDVLGVRRAVLIPLGPLAPLAGPPLAYPPNTRPTMPAVPEALTAPRQAMIVPLDSSTDQDLAWAVPLWGEQGLVGALALSEKTDGGSFAEEEIELARAAGEQFLDALAGVALGARLIELQRRRVAETRLLDQQARRVLHDDVLPLVHAALLTLGRDPAQSNDGSPVEAIAALSAAHRRLSGLLHDMAAGAAPEIARVGLVAALRKVADTEFSGVFDSIQWVIEAGAESCAQGMPDMAIEVIYYAAREAMRNAARHGLRPSPHVGVAEDGGSGRGSGGPAPGLDDMQALHLHVGLALSPAGHLRLTVADDGAGTDVVNAAGTGHGLALHSAMLAVVGGTLALESASGGGTRVILDLPTTFGQAAGAD